MSTPFQSHAATMTLRSGIHVLNRALDEAGRSGNSPAFRQLMRNWYDIADVYLEVVTSNRTFSCRVNCSACCFDNPQGVLAAEMALIEDSLNPFMLDQLRDDVEKFQVISKKQDDPEQRGVAFKRLESPCPLLDTTGSCRVYDVRPMACRGFFAETRSDWCHPSNSHNQEAVMLGIEWPVAVTDLLLKISHRINPKVPQDTLRSSMLSKIESMINNSDSI